MNLSINAGITNMTQESLKKAKIKFYLLYDKYIKNYYDYDYCEMNRKFATIIRLQ